MRYNRGGNSRNLPFQSRLGVREDQKFPSFSKERVYDEVFDKIDNNPRKSIGRVNPSSAGRSLIRSSVDSLSRRTSVRGMSSKISGDIDEIDQDQYQRESRERVGRSSAGSSRRDQFIDEMDQYPIESRERIDRSSADSSRRGQSRRISREDEEDVDEMDKDQYQREPRERVGRSSAGSSRRDQSRRISREDEDIDEMDQSQRESRERVGRSSVGSSRRDQSRRISREDEEDIDEMDQSQRESRERVGRSSVGSSRRDQSRRISREDEEDIDEMDHDQNSKQLSAYEDLLKEERSYSPRRERMFSRRNVGRIDDSDEKHVGSEEISFDPYDGDEKITKPSGGIRLKRNVDNEEKKEQEEEYNSSKKNSFLNKLFRGK